MVLVILLLFNRCSIKSQVPNLDVQVDNITKMKSKDNKDCDLFSVSVNLMNNTDSVVRYWTMTCSWQENWVYNYNTIHFHYDDCDSNFPTLEELKPNQKKTFNGVIENWHSLNTLSIKYYKIGFVLINEKEVAHDSDFEKVLVDKIKNKKDIIWSKAFELN